MRKMLFNRGGNNNKNNENRSSLNRFTGQNQNQNQDNFNAHTNSTNGREQENNEQWMWPVKGGGVPSEGDSEADTIRLRSPVSLRSYVLLPSPTKTRGIEDEEGDNNEGDENFGDNRRRCKNGNAEKGAAKSDHFCHSGTANNGNLSENNNFGGGKIPEKGSGVVYRRPPFLNQSSAVDGDEEQRENLVISMNDEEISPASAKIGHNSHPRFSSFRLFSINNNSQSQVLPPPQEPLQQRQNQIQQQQPPKKVTFSAAPPKNESFTTTDKPLPSLLVSGVPSALIPLAKKENNDNNNNMGKSSNGNELANENTQKPSSSSSEKAERQTPKPPKQKTVAFGLTTNLQETVLKNKPSETSLFGSLLSTRRGPSLLANQELSDLKKLVNAQQTQIAELNAHISALSEADERRREEMDVLRVRLSTLCELVEELAIGGWNSPTINGGEGEIGENNGANEGELSPPALVSDEKLGEENEGTMEIIQLQKQKHRSRLEESETARQIQTFKKRAHIVPSPRQITPSVVPTLSAAVAASTRMISSFGGDSGSGIIRGGDERGGGGENSRQQKQRLLATLEKEETTRHIVRRSVILHQGQSSTDNSRSLKRATAAPIISTTTKTVLQRRRRTSRSGIFISDDTNSNKNYPKNEGRGGPLVQELSSSSSSSLIDDGTPLMNNGCPRGNVSEGLEQLMASFRHASTESIRSLYDDDEDF